jgi:uncharacterized protein (UPF0335 family)
MKRSDLKKILMEEAVRALALREDNKGSPDTVSENVPNPEWRSRVAAAAAAKPEAADISNLLNAESLEQYISEYNKLVNADQRNLKAIDDDVVGLVQALQGRGNSASKIVNFLRSRSRLSAFGNAKTLEKFIELATSGAKSTAAEPVTAAPQKDADDDKVNYGLTSKDNPDSLYNILSKAGFEVDVIRKVIAKMKQLADDDNIVLEAVSLRGRGSEQDRVMNSESVGELITLIRKLIPKEDANQRRAMMKALNNWGNRNTVRFEKPTFAPTAPAQPETPDDKQMQLPFDKKEPEPEPAATPVTPVFEPESDEGTELGMDPDSATPPATAQLDPDPDPEADLKPTETPVDAWAIDQGGSGVLDIKRKYYELHGKGLSQSDFTANFQRSLDQWVDWISPYLPSDWSDLNPDERLDKYEDLTDHPNSEASRAKSDLLWQSTPEAKKSWTSIAALEKTLKSDHNPEQLSRDKLAQLLGAMEQRDAEQVGATRERRRQGRERFRMQEQKTLNRWKLLAGIR